MIAKIAVGTSPTLVRPTETRRLLIIQNLSDTDVFIALEGSAGVTTDTGANPGLRLNANGGVFVGGEESHLPGGAEQAIYAIHGGTGTKNISVQTY
jgi:hypothetical protein